MTKWVRVQDMQLIGDVDYSNSNRCKSSNKIVDGVDYINSATNELDTIYVTARSVVMTVLQDLVIVCT